MMKQPKVLFVTNRDDFEVDFLIYKFIEHKIPYLRLNSEDITNFSINYDLNDVYIHYKGNKCSFKDLNSVYFRRAPTLFPPSQDLNDTAFINRERRDFLEGLYQTLNCKWINPIFSTYIAEKKIYQLSVAKGIGFKIPETITSNDPKEILTFIKQNEKCIIKPICHGLQITRNGAYSIYTSEIKDFSWLENKSIFESPVLIQEKIEKYRDIRSTVIGKQIFSVEIETDDIDRIDWRKPNLKKEYKVHKLPKYIEMLMLKLHDKLNLVYSAFDFVLTPEGQYYFLETNPAGEWVWLERELNLPISNAIIQELLT